MLTLFKTPAVSSASARVDRAAGIIRGASIVTIGEARGHGVHVDSITLAQVVECANRRGGTGVAIKFNKDTFDHGPGGVAGSARNFRVVGRQVVADLYLLKNFSEREYLLELVEEQPTSFGLSMDFTMTEEAIGSRTFARVQALDAVTIVDIPAANSNGFFRAGSSFVGVVSKLFTFRSNQQPTMSTSATAFAAKIKSHESAGATHGLAILKARQGDAAGFNAWAATRQTAPLYASPQGLPRATAAVTTSATAFAAKVRALESQPGGRPAAILRAHAKDRTGFNAWCAAGRPE